MSELKTYKFLGIDEVYPDANLGSDYYLKSEADKAIAHNKFKRCLAMAKACCEGRDSILTRNALRWRWWGKWFNRWLELAEQFKPNSTTPEGE